jgi:agmatinase
MTGLVWRLGQSWHPRKYPSAWVKGEELAQGDFTHGTMFCIASEEGLIDNTSSVHGGLRTGLSGEDYSDYLDDSRQGFLQIEADDIDDIGVEGIVQTIMRRIGTELPVYLSIDIDVKTPA